MNEGRILDTATLPDRTVHICSSRSSPGLSVKQRHTSESTDSLSSVFRRPEGACQSQGWFFDRTSSSEAVSTQKGQTIFVEFREKIECVKGRFIKFGLLKQLPIGGA